MLIIREDRKIDDILIWISDIYEKVEDDENGLSNWNRLEILEDLANLQGYFKNELEEV